MTLEYDHRSPQNDRKGDLSYLRSCRKSTSPNNWTEIENQFSKVREKSLLNNDFLKKLLKFSLNFTNMNWFSQFNP